MLRYSYCMWHVKIGQLAALSVARVGRSWRHSHIKLHATTARPTRRYHRAVRPCLDFGWWQHGSTYRWYTSTHYPLSLGTGTGSQAHTIRAPFSRSIGCRNVDALTHVRLAHGIRRLWFSKSNSLLHKSFHCCSQPTIQRSTSLRFHIQPYILLPSKLTVPPWNRLSFLVQYYWYPSKQ